MAFMGRGPSSAGNSGNNSFGNINNGRMESGFDDDISYSYSAFPFGMYRYRYIAVDTNYFIIETIITAIIFIFGVITYFATYEPTIIDPIEGTKKLFITGYLITVAVSLLITLIVNFFSKDKNALIKRLTVIFAISAITMIVMFGIKLNLDVTYTEEKFAQIYEEQNPDKKDDTEKKITVGLTGAKMKTDKEIYVDQCMKIYNIFRVKSYGIAGLHLLLNALIIYQIVRLGRIEDRKEQLNKDDAVLFDEEDNVI